MSFTIHAMYFISVPIDNCSQLDVEDLLSELEVMKHLEPHQNILNLLGYCTGKQ